MKDCFGIITDIGLTQSLSLDPGNLGDRWVIIEPGPEEAYLGPLSSSESLVKPEQIGATWYPGNPSKIPFSNTARTGTDDGSSLIVLCFHSGSFLWMTGRPDDCDFCAGLLTSRLAQGTKALFPQYRLAGDQKNPTPWPGPVHDALTSYLYLINERGIPPNRIVFAGDSSGSTMAVALLRYLACYPECTKGVQGFPKACLIFSPSIDYSFEGDSQAIDASRNYRTDYIDGRLAAWGARVVAPPPIRLDNPYLSPVMHPFATPVPIFVQAGGGEVLCNSARMFVEVMKAVSGNKTEYLETPEAPHDIFMAGNIIGWQKEAEEVVDAAGAFICRI
jgi:acetyl esterase/lipase